MRNAISSNAAASTPLLSAVDLAHRLNVSVASIYVWTKRGMLSPPRRLGRSSRWLWSDVEAALAGLPVGKAE